MTTRAGLIGILTGLMTTILIYPLFAAWHSAYPNGVITDTTLHVWIGAVLAGFLMFGGGFFAGRRSGSAHPGRCAALGGLASGLAGTIVFCLWGAAAAGSVWLVSPSGSTVNEIVSQYSQIEIIDIIVRQTQGIFLVLFLGGTGLGAVGGWLSHPRHLSREEVFNKVEPQMAMNVAITAVPASLVAAILAAVVISSLTDTIGRQTGEIDLDQTIVYLPLLVSLLLLVISQFALTLVVPHETRQAEHRCGTNEVKMAAFVGIGTAPLLILLLLLIEPDFFLNPLVIIALLVSTAMSLKSLHSLARLVLPRRDSFPLPLEGWKKTEASLFGSIADSYAPRLVVLCIGCGMVMVLPIYVSVLSILINLANVPTNPVVIQAATKATWRLFLIQGLISTGVITVTIITLSLIYMFYLNLGRWFSKRNVRRSN